MRTILSTWLLLLSLNLEAQTPLQPKTELAETAQGTVTYQASFAQFMTANEQAILRNTSGAYTITLPIPDRIEVQQVRFHLEYISSVSLLDERSHLAVYLNGQIIAQIPLRHEQPEGSVDLRLPLDLLTSGYNRLTIQAAQHYTLKCEDPSAPELRTQIDTERSHFIFDGRIRPLPAKLTQLMKIFDRKNWGPQKLNIAVSDSELDLGMKWGALAAEGVALRLDYVPLQVSRVSTPPPNADTLVVATAAQLDGLLDGLPHEEVHGSYIGLIPLPHSNFFAIILSGQTAEQLERAVKTFCELNYPFPDTPGTEISELRLPNFDPYQGQKIVGDNVAYRLSDLGFSTATIQGWTHGNPPDFFEFQLNLPPDVYTPETSQVQFLLHFAHGAGMREDSVLNLYINGLFENAIFLNNLNGAAYRDYKVAVPTRNLKPGNNIIRFIPAMVPLKSDFCQIIQEQNLLFTLFDDSVVRIPSLSHYAELPNLELFERTIFPLVEQPDGRDLTVQVAERDDHSLGAVWTLMAKLAQKAGLPFNDAEVTFNQDPSDRNLVVMGTVDQISTRVMEAAPFNLGSVNRVGYRQTLLTSTGSNSNETEEQAVARVHLSGGLGDLGIAMQFRSPYHSNKTVFLVAASDSDRLFERVSELVSPTTWNSLRGDVAVWDQTMAVAKSQRIGPRFHLGTLSLNSYADYYYSKSPLLFIGVVLFAVLLLALIIRRALKSYKLRHHGPGDTNDTL